MSQTPRRAWFPESPIQWTGAALGILAFVLLLTLESPLSDYGRYGSRPAAAAAVTALMAIFWLTEALPISLTACLPLVLFPFVNAFEGGPGERFLGAVDKYIDPYIFLFAGGMAVAAAMQQCDLHRRIALEIMRVIGTEPKRLLLGVLIGTAFISLWISNTATAAMMLPIGLAIVAQCEILGGGKRLVHYGAALMLAIAYAANVGGVGTKIGTVPNTQFAQFMESRGIEVTFFDFLAVGLPFVVMFLPVVWLALWIAGRADAPTSAAGAQVVATELAKLGRMKRSERIVLVIFTLTVLTWMAGKPLTDWLKPQVTRFALTSAHVEGTIAMIAACAVLVARADGRRTLEWTTIKRVPWHALLLLGGAFAMAEGVKVSGLSDWLGGTLAGLRDLPPLAQTVLVCLVTVGISAVASNTSTVAVMLNVLASAVTPAQMPTVLFASTISASCDFALPAGTPPNAIVFGSGYVTVAKMAKTGVLLDIAAAVVAGLWCHAIVRFVL
jgi:solute carrier family 13 (sodium-dependent dicarboxylate transporter), member 2/3/5